MKTEDFVRWLFGRKATKALPASPSQLEVVLDGLRAEPLAFAALEARGELPGGASAFAARLRARHRHQLAQNLELVAAGSEIAAALQAEGIPCLLLKGAWLLSRQVYADPACRYMQDIDLLTHKSDRQRVAETLQRLGFVSPGVGGYPKHLPPFFRGRVMVEVHEWAYWDRLGHPVGLDLFAAHGPDSESNEVGRTVSHLLHHAFVSSPVESWLLVRLVADYLQLDRRFELKSAAVLSVLRSAGLEEQHLMVLGLARALLEDRPLTPDQSALLARFEPLGERDRFRSSLRYLRALAGSAPPWFMVGTARHLLLPDRATMSVIYGVGADSPLLTLCYVLRPFHLTARGVLTAVRELRRVSRDGGSE